MVQRLEEISVELLVLATSHAFQPFALLDRLALLRADGRDLPPVDAALQDFNRARILRRRLGERDEVLVTLKGILDQVHRLQNESEGGPTRELSLPAMQESCAQVSTGRGWSLRDSDV